MLFVDSVVPFPKTLLSVGIAVWGNSGASAKCKMDVKHEKSIYINIYVVYSSK